MFVLSLIRPGEVSKVCLSLALTVTAFQVLDGFEIIEFVRDKSKVVGGRAASTFVNPNKASESLLLLTIFSLPAVSKKLRGIFLLVVFFGVLASFSRGGILGWVVVVLSSCVVRAIPRNFLVWVGGCSAGIILAAPQIVQVVDRQLDADSVVNIQSQLSFFIHGETSSVSLEARSKALQDGLKKVCRKPLFGHGAGHSVLDVYSEDTPHNQFLLLAVDFGVLGVLPFRTISHFPYS